MAQKRQGRHGVHAPSRHLQRAHEVLQLRQGRLQRRPPAYGRVLVAYGGTAVASAAPFQVEHDGLAPRRPPLREGARIAANSDHRFMACQSNTWHDVAMACHRGLVRHGVVW